MAVDIIARAMAAMAAGGETEEKHTSIDIARISTGTWMVLVDNDTIQEVFKSGSSGGFDRFHSAFKVNDGYFYEGEGSKSYIYIPSMIQYEPYLEEGDYQQSVKNITLYFNCWKRDDSSKGTTATFSYQNFKLYIDEELNVTYESLDR